MVLLLACVSVRYFATIVYGCYVYAIVESHGSSLLRERAHINLQMVYGVRRKLLDKGKIIKFKKKPLSICLGLSLCHPYRSLGSQALSSAEMSGAWLRLHPKHSVL